MSDYEGEVAVRRMTLFTVLILISISVSGCLSSSPPELVKTPAELPSNEVSPHQKAVALQLTTANENSSTLFQYNYAEYLGDGRGITFGMIGFTTGTYDGNVLIKYYTKLNPDNNLAKYIPALDAIDGLPHTGNDGDSNDSIEGLEGFIEDVRSNSDPLFRQAQIDKMNDHYWMPAAKLFEDLGAKYPLTQAFLYDMTVNHGKIGAKRMVERTNIALGGSPVTGVDERDYLSKLMDLRYNYLVSTGNPGADRVNAYRRILEDGNLKLHVPLEYTVYGDDFLIDGNVFEEP